MKPFTTASFFDAGKIIDLGMKQAVPFLPRLNALADSVYASEKAKTVFKPAQPDSICITSIETPKLKYITRDFLISRIGFNDGDSVSIKDMNRGLRKLLGTRFLDYVSYELEGSPSGYKVKLGVVETYPTKAAFSLNYSDVFGASLIGNLTIRNVIVKNTRLSLSAEASKNPQVNVNIVSYFGDQMDFGFEIDGGYSRSILPVYRNGNGKYGTFAYRYHNASYNINFSPSTKYLFATGITIERHVLMSDTGFPELFDSGVRKFGFEQAMVVAPFIFNSLDRRYFPTRGVKFEALGGLNFWLSEVYKGKEHARHLTDAFFDRGDDRFLFVKGSVVSHFPVSRRINLMVSAGANYFVINEAPLSSLYFVGGSNVVARHHDLPFTGLNYREQIVENYIYWQSIVRINIFKMFYANAIFNGIYNTRPYYRFMPPSISYFDKEWLIGYGLQLSADTMLGPASFGFGMNNYDNRPRFYFNLGFPF